MSLREHWLKRLEAGREKMRRATDETTYRICKLYIAGSAHWFRTGKLNSYQFLLVKPDQGTSGLPLTRADWYQG